MKHLLVTLLLLTPFFADAQKNPGEAASIESIRLLSRVKPGARVTASVKVKLNKGYHAHSNKPSESIYIPTKLTPTVPKGVKLLSVKYPKGKSKKLEGLAKPLSIYEGEFSIRVTFKLDPKATLPVKIPATLSYQACEGKLCYRPAKLKFDITLPTQ